MKRLVLSVTITSKKIGRKALVKNLSGKIEVRIDSGQRLDLVDPCLQIAKRVNKNG